MIRHDRKQGCSQSYSDKKRTGIVHNPTTGIARGGKMAVKHSPTTQQKTGLFKNHNVGKTCFSQSHAYTLTDLMGE